MELTTFSEPARVRKWGEQVIVGVTSPAKVKVQTTGPGSQTLLEEGPGAGKTWEVLIRVEVKET